MALLYKAFPLPEHAPTFKPNRKRSTGARPTHARRRQEFAELSIKGKSAIPEHGYHRVRNNRMVDMTSQVRVQDPTVIMEMSKTELQLQLKLWSATRSNFAEQGKHMNAAELRNFLLQLFQEGQRPVNAD